MLNPKQKTCQIRIEELRDNPWRFRGLSEKDFENLVSEIKKNGIGATSPPMIAKINKNYYIIDGHSRIKAAKSSEFDSIPCIIAKNVSDFRDLRIKTFQLNRDGFSNPVLLSEMFYEDLKILDDIQKVATAYGVEEDYVESLLKIKDLHQDTKSLIQKTIHVAKRKYQFLLNQITPSHLSALNDLEKEKQLEVVDWIFRDLMYGPPDESMVSIPSVYEILEEIEKISNKKQKKTYKKRNEFNKILNSKEVMLECRCGAKFDIDKKSDIVYEFIEQDNIILKKEYQSNENKSKIFSSSQKSKKELIKIIQESKNEKISVIISKE